MEVDSASSAQTNILSQGAEAKLTVTDFFGRPAVIKERFSKDYRHPELDGKLNKDRTMHEVRNLVRCRMAGIRVPLVYYIHKAKHSIWMEYIDGVSLKQYLYDTGAALVDHEDLAVNVGTALAQMHGADVIHGDLTSSNFMRCPNGDIVVIDLGLSYISNGEEDRAVDLYVLERAFASTHPNSEALFARILEVYADKFALATGTLARLEEGLTSWPHFIDCLLVRARGRKRCVFG